MEAKAAIIREKGGSFSIESITLDAPRRNEVLVKIVASGVCHTDLLVRDQYYPPALPVVLGHEGSGVVEKIGEGVTTLSVGDHVVISYMSCGNCHRCLMGQPSSCDRMFELNFGGIAFDGRKTIRANGAEISGNFFGQSSFATYSLAHERNCVKVPKDAPLELLGPLGCGLQTGSGSILNALDPPAGSTVVIFGAGGVGLSALLGARIAEATNIIQVDIKPNRLALAAQLGATHTINGLEKDPVAEIQRITGGGALYALETSGNTTALKQAIACIRPGGVVGVVGAPPLGSEVPLDVNFVLLSRTVRGIVEGESIPQIFIPRLIDLYQKGKFPIDKLIKVYRFDEINKAVHDSEQGTTIKPVLRMS